MARKQVEREREEIAGFWTRAKGSTLVGKVQKKVESENGGFWLIHLTTGGASLQGKKEGDAPIEGKKGQLVGVSGTFGLEVLEDYIGSTVYLTSNGKQKHPTKKNMTMWDIKVEVDDN